MSKIKNGSRLGVIKKLLPKVINSNNEEIEFDVKYIINSVEKEINLPPEFLSKMVEDIVRRLINGRVSTLTAPMIRELVCAYLVEKGYQKERYHYTRLGLPYADFKELHAILMRLDPAQKFHEVEKAIIKDLIQEAIYLQIKREYHGVDILYNDL